MNLNKHECLGVGLLVGFFVAAGVAIAATTDNSDIRSGKSIIIGNASYECVKTNELEGE